jgi:hypothetical protein
MGSPDLPEPAAACGNQSVSIDYSALIFPYVTGDPVYAASITAGQSSCTWAVADLLTQDDTSFEEVVFIINLCE